MTERTYGTYAYRPPQNGEKRGAWRLTLELILGIAPAAGVAA